MVAFVIGQDKHMWCTALYMMVSVRVIRVIVVDLSAFAHEVAFGVDVRSGMVAMSSRWSREGGALPDLVHMRFTHLLDSFE